MLTYEDVKREFFARAEKNCTSVQLKKMEENFPIIFVLQLCNTRL